MGIDFATLNWFAIIVAVIANFAIGFVWYGPLFGKAWLAALGKTEEDIPPSPTPFVITFFTTLITSVATAGLLQMLDAYTWQAGLCLGLVIGIAFIACSYVSDGAFSRSPWRLSAILGGYRTVSSVAIALILAVWQ